MYEPSEPNNTDVALNATSAPSPTRIPSIGMYPLGKPANTLTDPISVVGYYYNDHVRFR